MSRIPGPLSEATIEIPCRLEAWTIFKVISPLRAYDTMLRASSEMDVAMSVASPVENPSSMARARPFWRAVTISWSEWMATRISPALTVCLSVRVLEFLSQVSQTFLQVQRRGDAFQCQPQLNHCKRHFRLNPNYNRFRSAQPDHVGDLPKRPRCKRVHDIHCGNIDDNRSGAKLNNLLY